MVWMVRQYCPLKWLNHPNGIGLKISKLKYPMDRNSEVKNQRIGRKIQIKNKLKISC